MVSKKEKKNQKKGQFINEHSQLHFNRIPDGLISISNFSLIRLASISLFSLNKSYFHGNKEEKIKKEK